MCAFLDRCPNCRDFVFSILVFVWRISLSRLNMGGLGTKIDKEMCLHESVWRSKTRSRGRKDQGMLVSQRVSSESDQSVGSMGLVKMMRNQSCYIGREGSWPVRAVSQERDPDREESRTVSTLVNEDETVGLWTWRWVSIFDYCQDFHKILALATHTVYQNTTDLAFFWVCCLKFIVFSFLLPAVVFCCFFLQIVNAHSAGCKILQQ